MIPKYSINFSWKKPGKSPRASGLLDPGFGRAGPDLSGYRAGPGFLTLGFGLFSGFSKYINTNYSAYIGPTQYKCATVVCLPHP